MNRKINFSHEYLKFAGKKPKTGILLHVFLEDSKELSKDFVEYDTAYRDESSNLGFYELPKGKVLVLLFGIIDNSCFTTIRRWTPSKELYYKSSIGEVFDVIIESEQDKRIRKLGLAKCHCRACEPDSLVEQDIDLMRTTSERRKKP